MHLSYGADPLQINSVNDNPVLKGGVELSILSITDYERRAVLTDDETTYLWDHVGIRCTAWLNPGATGNNQSPVVTELQLVNLLKNDRRFLKIWMDSGPNDASPQEVLLASPYPKSRTDAKFGPTCLVHALQLDHGNGSIVVDLEFHTDISPCGPVSSTSKSVVLSNRWEYGVSYNPETYAEIRTIEGVCIFRMDNLLAVLNGNVDMTREFIIPPCPPGFQRHPELFEPSSGGNAIRYKIVDTQELRNFPAGRTYGAASIEIVEQRTYGIPFTDQF